MTPSINIPGTDIVLTERAFVDWYKAATKDDRANAVKVYEYYKAQEINAGDTPKSFEDWFMQAAEASGKSLEAVLAEFAAKRDIVAEDKLSGSDFASKALKEVSSDDSTWYNPPGVDEIMKKHNLSNDDARRVARSVLQIDEMDRMIRAYYEPKGKTVVRGDKGWYINGKFEVNYP